MFRPEAADLATELLLAWLYVGVRIVHSLIQAITNRIMVRFGVYLGSEAIMLGLFFRTVAMVA